ncbi:hypothetical protein PVAND_001424 [Polypedilum vanderplanki]|uniref:Odorant receptor n=1 Tax=Polypedilum vanderplanki TaxID=319348 RepID=A0A9J6BNE8_POLVA|nr:hypothetical protein PVAND_001424 [Polypedilum vanderplanki]
MSKVKPSQKLKELQNFTSKLSLNVGVDLFDPQPKPNRKMIISTLLSLIWQGIVIKSIIKDLPSLKILTLAFVHLSFFSQGLTRTLNLAVNPFTTSKLRDTVLDFYLIRELDPTNQNLLLHSIKRTEKIVKAFLIFLCCIFNSSFLLLIVAILTGAKILLVPVFIPYTDASTFLSYLANIGLQILLGVIGFFTFSTYDATILIYGLHTLTIVEILKLKIKSFNEELESNKKLESSLLIEIKIKVKFLEIIKDFEEYQNFLNIYGILLKFPFTVAIIVNMFGIFLCLDFALTANFIMGFGASLGLFIQLLLPLIVAVILTIQKDRINKEANKISWNFLMTDSNKKIFQQFLFFNQNHKGIKIPIFGNINMKKILKILSFIYFVSVNYANLEWFVIKE